MGFAVLYVVYVSCVLCPMSYILVMGAGIVAQQFIGREYGNL